LGPQYTIGKVLKHIYEKWVHICHLKLWDKNLWSKEWLGIKLEIWLQTIWTQKINPNDFLFKHVMWHWKGPFKGHNFFVENSSIKACMWKLWTYNIIVGLIMRFFCILGLLTPTSFEVFCHFDVIFTMSHNVCH
jgi:hypothetical protein